MTKRVDLMYPSQQAAGSETMGTTKYPLNLDVLSTELYDVAA